MLEGANNMNDSQIIRKSGIRKLFRCALIFIGAGVVNGAIVVMVIMAHYATRVVCQRLLILTAVLALPLSIAALVVGIQCERKYRLYMRYFEATGLTQCSKENVRRWKATHDVTR